MLRIPCVFFAARFEHLTITGYEPHAAVKMTMAV